MRKKQVKRSSAEKIKLSILLFLCWIASFFLSSVGLALIVGTFLFAWGIYRIIKDGSLREIFISFLALYLISLIFSFIASIVLY